MAPLVGFMISKRGGDEHLWVVILSGACLTALGLVLRHLGSIKTRRPYRVGPLLVVKWGYEAPINGRK